MAKKVTVDLVDDTDPEQHADETVVFGLDTVTYEIDLSSKNAAKLREDFQHWLEYARRVSGQRRTRSTGLTGSSGLPLADIREWAKANGHNVSSRGRVSAEIVRAYNTRNETPVAVADKAPAKKAAPKKAASPVTGETILAGAAEAAKQSPEFSSSK